MTSVLGDFGVTSVCSSIFYLLLMLGPKMMMINLTFKSVFVCYIVTADADSNLYTVYVEHICCEC